MGGVLVCGTEANVRMYSDVEVVLVWIEVKG